MIDRRALIVGINTYKMPGNDLTAAIADAEAITALLAHHEDKDPNYTCRSLYDTMEDGQPITRAALKQACRELFENFDGDVLLYFSGHGCLTDTGGYLCTFDAAKDDWGVSMQDIVQMAFDSKARDIVFILDCCHSGDIANPAMLQSKANPLAALRENMTVIAASRASEVSLEAGGKGLFTAALSEGLEGGAADHMGWVTASSLYSYLERRFGAWDKQRPVYKSYTTRSNVVRECAPLIDRQSLRELVKFFPNADFKYPLDPEHEPEDEHGDVHAPVNSDKVNIAGKFKTYRDAGLLRPSEPGEQLYWTARRGHTVELTTRGREYWRLVVDGRI